MTLPSRFRLDPALTRVDPTAFVAVGAVVVGDVAVGAGSGVWFGAVVRGDTESITIGDDTNVQDGAVVHADPGFPCRLGDRVTVGHRCIVHGATIGAGSMVGMGAIVMNGVVVGERCLVGAGALLTPGKVFPSDMLIVGSPAKAVRPLTDAEQADIAASSGHYAAAGAAYRAAGWHTPGSGAPKV